jgi:hypothetical protein
MARKVFTSQKISLFFAGREFRVQTLVSNYGAKYVFDEDDLPPEAKATMGADVQMAYKGIPALCRLIRESNAAGTIYNLRFVNPSQALLQQINKDVAASGLPSPWMRGLPRLSTDVGKQPLPVPVLAIVSHDRSTHYLNVRNFTLGGLLIEYSGQDLKDLDVGSQIEFDLVTSGGDKMPGISAVVTHLSVELGNAQGEGGLRTFGIKFLELSPLNQLRYRGLIREHCRLLREENPEG